MTAQHVMVLSGPNLNRLGSREPEIYGSETLDDIADAVTREGDSLGMTVDFRQSNDEAELIGWLHEAVDTASDVVLNPAAFTHYSYAIRDACAMVTTGGRQLVEVHLSNPAARESFRHTSVVAGVATGTIAGFGSHSYLLALRALVSLRRPCGPRGVRRLGARAECSTCARDEATRSSSRADYDRVSLEKELPWANGWTCPGRPR